MATAKKSNVIYYYGTGRRKSASARVFLTKGTGKITVNNRSLEEYFPRANLRIAVKKPFGIVGMEDRFDAKITVCGGGISGQAEAIHLGVARALVDFDEGKTAVEAGNVGALGHRVELRKNGSLTRNAKEVERKKYGLHKARKRAQYSKR